MDNFRFDVTSAGTEALEKALRFVLESNGWTCTTGFAVKMRPDTGFTGNPTTQACLILYWTDSPNATKLPFAMNHEETITFVKGWMRTVPYPEEPDIDGSVKRGWRVYNEEWGHVNNEYEAYIAIEPTWALFGK